MNAMMMIKISENKRNRIPNSKKNIFDSIQKDIGSRTIDQFSIQFYFDVLSIPSLKHKIKYG